MEKPAGRGKLNTHKLRKLLPEDIVTRQPTKEVERVTGFFLTVALIANDVRDLFWFVNWRDEFDPIDPTNISGHTGEHTGIGLHLYRLEIGILHETIRFLETSEDLFKEPMIQRCVNDLSAVEQTMLEALRGNLRPTEANLTPLDRKELLDLQAVLPQIRNNISFHYYQTSKNLLRGFRKAFYESKADTAHKYALFASKPTEYAQNRCYYVDAAVEGYLRAVMETVGDSKDVLERVHTSTVRVARVFVSLLDNYYSQFRKQ